MPVDIYPKSPTFPQGIPITNLKEKALERWVGVHFPDAQANEGVLEMPFSDLASIGGFRVTQQELFMRQRVAEISR